MSAYTCAAVLVEGTWRSSHWKDTKNKQIKTTIKTAASVDKECTVKSLIEPLGG